MLSRVVTLFAVLMASGCAFAATCSQGAGQLMKPFVGGYVMQIGPSLGTTQNQCQAALLGPDGKTEFQVTAPEVDLGPASGNDINADGKPDIVLQTYDGARYTLDILTPGAGPALLRDFTNTLPFTVDDRAGDGKFEIWTKDNAFDGIDNLSSEASPHPPVVFRLEGKRLYYVSSLFWPEYEADINLMRARLPKTDLDHFMGYVSATEIQGKQQQEDPETRERMLNVKSAVLTIVLDYLYAGKGQQAWGALKDMWPYNDRMRIQQDILRDRMTGVLRELSRNTATSSSAATPGNTVAKQP